MLYAPEPGTTALLYALRLAFGLAMATSLVLGVRSIGRGDVAHHRAWMIRAYAIALAAGTQAITEGLGTAVIGTGGLRGDLAKAAGWVINVAVAEWVVRRNGDPARQGSYRRDRTIAVARPGARR